MSIDPKDYAIVIQEVCQLQGIGPDATIIRNVASYCKSLNHELLATEYPIRATRLSYIAKAYIGAIAPREAFDYDTYITSDIKKNKAIIPDLSFAPLTTWMGAQMPILSSRSMSVYIDSRRRNFAAHSTNGVTDFSFTLVPRQTRTTIIDGGIPCRAMPSNVTYFKLGKIMLPYPQRLREMNFMNEVTLTFTALRSNGIIAYDDTYHFSFTYAPSSVSVDIVELTPVNEFCKFDPPIQTIDDISLRFNDPIYPITFPEDRIQTASIDYGSADGRISFSRPHMASDGDIVVIEGLSSLDASKDGSILSQVNNVRGSVVTVINANTISIGSDFTRIGSADPESLPWVQFYSRTFRFPMEIGYQSTSQEIS